VRGLAQDREGFLWIATHTGLYRYDGYRFRRFTSADGLAGNWFTDLTIDDEGSLWVSGAGGLSRYRNGAFQVVLPASEIARFSPRYGSPLVGSIPGKLYVSTSSGVFSVDVRSGEADMQLPGPLQLRHLLQRDPSLTQTALPIFASNANEICALVDEGQLRCWDSDTMVLVREEALPGERNWVTANAAPDGTIYAATADKELYARKQRGEGFARLPVPYGGIGKLLVLRDGTLCVPDTQGFWLVGEDGTERVELEAGLEGIAVSQTLMDADGGFWIATAGAGLVQWLGMRAWESWGLAEGLPNATVSQIVFSTDGSQWLGTGQGLARRRPGESRFQVVQPPGAARSSNPVFGLAAGDRGDIWFSEEPGSLRYWNPATGQTFRVDLHNDNPVDMVCHLLWHEGDLWIADTSGVSRLRQGNGQWQLERVFPEAGEPVTAYRLAADQQGRMWAATQRGVVVMDGEQIERIGVAEGLLHRDVFGLSIEPNGNVVVHYRMPMGLTELRTIPGPAMRFTAHHFREHDGLASDKVYALHTDRRGNIWAGTENGLSVRNSSGQWVSFTQDDGLVWNDCAIGGLAEEPMEGSRSRQSIWVGTSRDCRDSGRRAGPADLRLQ
jgi:ligand-binding sensor domain-containing protein